MNVAKLVAELCRRRVTAVVDGNNIICRGPKGALTPKVIAALSQHKVELIEAMTWSLGTAHAAISQAMEMVASFYRTGAYCPDLFRTFNAELAQALGCQDINGIYATCQRFVDEMHARCSMSEGSHDH